MNRHELEQLIELHTAYDKHIPMKDHSGAMFYGRWTMCSTCLLPLVIQSTSGDYKPMSGSPQLSVVSLALDLPQVFSMFISRAKDMGVLTHYADILADSVDDNYPIAKTIWTCVNRLGGPSEECVDRIFRSPVDAYDAACYVPSLRAKAYKAILKSTNVASMFGFARVILNQPDIALLKRAKQIQGKTVNGAATYEEFRKWFGIKLNRTGGK